MRSAARAGLLALAILSGSGCGKPVLRIADASLGDYYTDKEWKKLSQEQRDEYCAELARQDSLYRAEIEEARGILSEILGRRAPLHALVDSLARAVDSLEARLAEARNQAPRTSVVRPAPDRALESVPGGEEVPSALAHSHRVRPGDSLWRIAATDSALRDGRAWHRIYQANRGRVRDPNLIFPGQEIIIPR